MVWSQSPAHRAASRMRPFAWIPVVVVLFIVGCAQVPTTPSGASRQPPPAPAPQAAPETVPAPAPQSGPITERGKVSLYGDDFAGRKTASGDIFDPEALTMAHPTLPFGTKVRVVNLANHRSVEVTVNDRGPFIRGRIADVSLAAGRALGMLKNGVIDAALEVVGKTPAGKTAAEN